MKKKKKAAAGKAKSKGRKALPKAKKNKPAPALKSSKRAFVPDETAPLRAPGLSPVDPPELDDEVEISDEDTIPEVGEKPVAVDDEDAAPHDSY